MEKRLTNLIMLALCLILSTTAQKDYQIIFFQAVSVYFAAKYIYLLFTKE